MESDELLKNNEKWYEMTREEQMETVIKKSRRVYELDKETYYQNYESSSFSWYNIMF